MSLEGIRVIGTYSCLRNCEFCYQKTRKGGFLKPDNFEKVLKDLNFIPIYFTFQGGELAYFEEETKEIIKLADRYFPQVFRKSLTTNGDGKIEFYQSLKKYGITHFSFSLHNISKVTEKIRNKIIALKSSGFFTVRVNCYFSENNIEDVLGILNFCIENDVQLTLCEDLRLGQNPANSHEILIKYLSNYEVTKYKHQYIYWLKDNNYKFWVYKHLDHYDYNNLIVLPDGSTTITFDDVQECRGNYDA
jgi:MoaA/NifB/PqqE/SkfB family radical SAM enzyme